TTPYAGVVRGSCTINARGAVRLPADPAKLTIAPGAPRVPAGVVSSAALVPGGLPATGLSRGAGEGMAAATAAPPVFAVGLLRVGGAYLVRRRPAGRRRRHRTSGGARRAAPAVAAAGERAAGLGRAGEEGRGRHGVPGASPTAVLAAKVRQPAPPHAVE